MIHLYKSAFDYSGLLYDEKSCNLLSRKIVEMKIARDQKTGFFLESVEQVEDAGSLWAHKKKRVGNWNPEGLLWGSV